MRRTARALLMLGVTAVLAAAVAAVPAATATKDTSYRLVGIETSAGTNVGTFAGTLVGRIGVWQATIYHTVLAKEAGSETTITSDSPDVSTFTLKALGSPRIDGFDVTGTLTAQAPVGRFFCSQQFILSEGTFKVGSATGSFEEGTLTHYGTMSGGVCNAVFATISATITIP